MMFWSVLILILGGLGLIWNVFWHVLDARKNPENYWSKDKWSDQVAGTCFGILVATAFFAAIPPFLLVVVGLVTVVATFLFVPRFIYAKFVEGKK